MLPPTGSSWNCLRANVPEYARYDGLNAEWRIDSYDSYTNSFSLRSASFGDYMNTNVRWSETNVDAGATRFILAKAVASSLEDIIGPFSFDLGQPFAIGGTNLVLNQEVRRG